jgi:hypothetical protein
VVQYHRFHLVISLFFPFLSCRRNVQWGVRGEDGEGGGGKKRRGYLRIVRTHARNSAGASERGSPGEIHDQSLINHVPNFRESYFNRSHSCAISLSDSLRPTLRSLSVAVPPPMSNFERIEQAVPYHRMGNLGCQWLDGGDSRLTVPGSGHRLPAI